MSCSQNFSAIIRSISKKTSEGENPLTGFSSIIEIDETRDQIIDSIASAIVGESKKSKETILSYNFKDAKRQLKSLSTRKYPGLTEDVINNIISQIELKLVKDDDIFLTNPLVLKEDGSSELLFDFSNISNLTGGIESMENFIDSELESGLFKVTFVDNSYSIGSEQYEPFVVTNTALNKNLLIYKNELWSYIVNAVADSGQFSPKIKDTKLYENGVLNWELFVKNEKGISPYMEVLSYLKNEMKNRLSASDSYKHIKIYKDNGYSLSQAYLKSLILSNFDNFILSKHPDKMSVNLNSINNYSIPTNGEEKYKLQFQWTKSTKIDNSEVASDIDKNSSSLVKMLADFMPYYEQKKEGKQKKLRWIANRQGLTVGKSNVDSIGAVLNDMNPNFTFKLHTMREDGTIDIVDTTIGDAFKQYDNGNLDFESILYWLINSADSDDQLKSREAVLVSLYNFLYGDKGIKHKFTAWKSANPNYADFVINPEVALVNHIRNTVKNVYRKETLISNGKTLDVLNIDSAVGSDFEHLINNLEIAWKNKNVTINDLDSITDYDSFFKFLTDSDKGGMLISDAAKKLFKEKVNIDFSSKTFKDAFSRLLSKQASGIKDTFVPGEDQNEGSELLDASEIIDGLKSQDVNKYLNLKELFKYRNQVFKYNILTQIKDSTGASMPTMGIANLASLFNMSFASAKKNSFWKKNPEVYKGMEILLEVVGKNSSTSTPDLYHNEAFKLGFTRQFLMSGVNEDKFLIQPWDFSDKPKIFAMAVNARAKITKSNVAMYGNNTSKLLKDFNPEELRDEFYFQQQNYYNLLADQMYEDYKLLDEDWFVKYNKKNPISSAENKVKAIEKFLEEKVSSKEKLQSLITSVFNNDKYVEITEDLHYTVYNGKQIKFNQQLKGNIQMFNNRHHFESWANMKEAKLLKYLDNIDISLEEIIINNGKLNDKAAISKISEYYNIPESELFTTSTSNGETKHTLNNSKKVGDKIKLSDMFSKYLWTKNLIVSQYANLTTKDVYLHPAKKDFQEIDLNNDESWDIYDVEENMRSTAFTKRMNIPGASMTIYGRGKNGISSNIKVAVMDDPSAETFNYSGEKHSQDISDGGGHTNPFFNELLIWSLPGLDLKKTQKPIGESVNNKFASTLKFAIFAISNEEVLKSMSSNRSAYTAMKKMNSFPLFEEGEEKKDIMKELDVETGKIHSIDLTTTFNNLWIPIKGVYKKFESLQWVEGNKYTLNYSDGKGSVESKSVKIDTLFDLWNALGGPFSATKDGETFSYSEDSIKAVSSIIKKHSMTMSPLKLKDKMIAMLLPKSAVKKGATNINDVNSVYDDKSKLAYFNFDTSFFGVQLKSYHSTEDSHTNEITQVISGIAENASTPELYNAVYSAIGNLVQEGLEKFEINISSKEGRKRVVDLFVKKLNNSTQINNSRIIVNGLADDMDEMVPIENKTLYKQFVSYVVSNINVDFIRRQFKGIASVLNPSHGIIKLFEDKNGRKLFSSDLLHLFEINPDNVSFVPSNEDLSEYDLVMEKVNWVLSNSEEFKSDPISISQIEPLDFISFDKDIEFNGSLIPAGTTIEVNKIDDYFNLKNILKDFAEPISVTRVYTTSRDLKPVRVTFDYKSGEKTFKSNLYDLDSVEFSWWLEYNKKKLKANNFEGMRPIDVSRYVEFINYIASTTGANVNDLSASNKLDLAQEYGKRWVNRNFDLLKAGKAFKSYSEVKQSDLESNAFDSILSYKNEKGELIKDNFTSRYVNTNIYTNENTISNYVHRNAENVHSNLNKKNFNLENTPLAEVSKEHFYKTIKDFTSIKPPKGMTYDLMLSNVNEKSSIYIALDGQKYYEKNNVLYERNPYSSVDKKVGTKIYINDKVNQNGDRIRLSNFGQPMYTLPKNHSVFKNDVTGQEVLLIKESRLLEEQQSVYEGLEQFVKKLESYNIVRFNEYNNYATNLTSKNDSLLALMNSVRRVASNKYLRDHITNKIKNYSEFKDKIDIVTLNNRSSLQKAYTDFIKTKGISDFENYLNVLADVRFASWSKSIKALSARIPAQAMQSFMSMDTVGYISGEANDIYVSHWQLWLQGSDYDIDKLYMMMYEFKDGIFSGWSPYFDILKERSFELPLPYKRPDYIWVNPKDLKAQEVPEDEEGELKEKPELKYDPLDLNDNNTIDLDLLLKEKGDDFSKLIFALKALEGESSIKYIKSSNSKLINKINRHNKYSSEAGIKNFIVYNLLKTSEDPANQVSSYSPISFGVYEDIKKKLGSEYSLSLYDGYTMYMQQEQNSIGKKVIGIAATGLKNYFALIKYYGDYYKKAEESGNIDVFGNGYFVKQFTLVDSKGKPKTYTVNKISGLNLNDNANNILKNHLRSLLSGNDSYTNKYTGKKITPEEMNKIIDEIVKISPDTDAALAISSILSLATDNAKELMLAKINAGIDFAGMHIYLNMLGIDTEIISSYMTSPKAKAIKNAMTRDLFVDTRDPSVIVRLNKLISPKYLEYKRELNKPVSSSLIKGSEGSLEFRDEEKIKTLKADLEEEEKKSGIDQEFLSEFLNIYLHASELTSMGSIFKVNQGSKSSQEDLYKLSNQIQSILTSQDTNYFRNEIEGTIQSKVEFIIKEKPYLKGQEVKIKAVLENAANNGISDGGKIDVNRYFNDPEYNKAITEYYNLIKYTFNIFDLLNNLPHFYQMYKAFIVGENYIANSVPKYKFLKEYASEIIKNATANDEINVFDIMKNIHTMGNSKLPVTFSPNIINAINDYYDSKVLKSFMGSLEYKISIKALMKYLNKKSITLLEYNKSGIEEHTFGIDDVDDLSIDFSSEYGLAQFRYVMENYIIPFEKKRHNSNGFLKQYTFGIHKNYNLKNKISYYLDKSNFSELEEIEIGMNQLINSGSSSENTEEGTKQISFELPIKESEDSVNPIKLIDLLSLYDLLVNEGKFGGNRSTVFLSKDIKNKEAISRKFVDYQNLVGNSGEFAEALFKSLSGDEGVDARKELYLRLFSKTLPDGSRSARVFEEPGGGEVITTNRYFSLLDSAGDAVLNFKSINLADDIITYIKNTYTNIDKNCE